MFIKTTKMVQTLYVKNCGNGVFDAREDYRTFMQGDVIGIYRLNEEVIVNVTIVEPLHEEKQ